MDSPLMDRPAGRAAAQAGAVRPRWPPRSRLLRSEMATNSGRRGSCGMHSRQSCGAPPKRRYRGGAIIMRPGGLSGVGGASSGRCAAASAERSARARLASASRSAKLAGSSGPVNEALGRCLLITTPTERASRAAARAARPPWAGRSCTGPQDALREPQCHRSRSIVRSGAFFSVRRYSSWRWSCLHELGECLDLARPWNASGSRTGLRWTTGSGGRPLYEPPGEIRSI